MYMIFLISLVQLEWSGLVGKDSYAKFAYIIDACSVRSYLMKFDRMGVVSKIC